MQYPEVSFVFLNLLLLDHLLLVSPHRTRTAIATVIITIIVATAAVNSLIAFVLFENGEVFSP